MRNKFLWPSLAGTLFLAAVVWAWFLSPGDRRQSPSELVEVALSGPAVEDRELAAAQLADWGEEARDEMRRVYRETDSPAVRANCIQGLGNIYDYDSMELFIDALDDETLVVRGRSSMAVNRMLGLRYSYRPGSPKEEREKYIAAVKQEWKAMQESGMLEEFKERLKRQGEKK